MGKQRAVSSGPQRSGSLSFSPRRQPLAWDCPHSGSVFPLTTHGGNSLTDRSLLHDSRSCQTENQCELCQPSMG